MAFTAQTLTSPGKQRPGQGNPALEEALRMAAELNGDAAGSQDKAKAFAVFRQILRDHNEAVRRRLCEAIKCLPELPYDIILTLASDQPSVALPFIAHSPLLTDDDLVKLVWRGDPARQVVIAARHGLAASVAGALAEVAGERVIRSLLANQSAELTQESLLSCLWRFPDDAAIQQALIARSHLPLAVAEAMLDCISPGLQQTLLSRHAVSPEVARENARHAGTPARWWRAGILSR